MRTSVRFAVAAMLVASSATMALAESSGKNDSVDYSPRVHTVAGTLPLADQHYTLAVSAPTQMNKKGEDALKSGVLAELRVNVESYPDGSSKGAAEALVSLDPWSMTFYTLGETHQTTVHVVAGQSTTAGDYVYNIQAVGPTGLGWGISNHRLTVTVSQPVALDTTPPDVKITSPVDKQAFTFCLAGTKVPMTVSAVDAESLVTAVEGSVNGSAFPLNLFTPAHVVLATGEFTASGVGAYTLGARATSAGGTGTAPAVGVSVNYAMSWLPPLSLGRTINGQAVPIKFAAHDCLGAFVADTSVRVEVREAGTLRFRAVYGTGSDAVRIDEDNTQYITNFHRPDSSSHSYTARVFFNDYLQAELTFAVK